VNSRLGPADRTRNGHVVYGSAQQLTPRCRPHLGQRSERAHRLPVQPGSAFLHLDRGTPPCC